MKTTVKTIGQYSVSTSGKKGYAVKCWNELSKTDTVNEFVEKCLLRANKRNIAKQNKYAVMQGFNPTDFIGDTFIRVCAYLKRNPKTEYSLKYIVCACACNSISSIVRSEVRHDKYLVSIYNEKGEYNEIFDTEIIANCTTAYMSVEHQVEFEIDILSKCNEERALYYDGYTADEIADYIGESKRTVWRRISDNK